MMLYTEDVTPIYWQDPLIASSEGNPGQVPRIPFSAHTAPAHYYEEQENN